MATRTPSATGRFGGDLSAFSLFEVCQFLMIVRQTGTLSLRSRDRSATITMHEGQIVGAVDDALQEGEEVFYGVVIWREGTFEFEPGAITPPLHVQIQQSTDSLLLEAARRLDEGESDPEGDPESEEGSYTHRLLESREFAAEFAGLLTSLDEEGEDSLDHQKDISLERLLSIARKRRAETIFLQVDEIPKARGPGGVDSIGRRPLTHRALDRLMRELVPADERGLSEEAPLRRAGVRHVEGRGDLHFEWSREGSAEVLVITRLRNDVPPLERYPVPESELDALLSAEQGLILLASPPRGGKSALGAALAHRAAERFRRHVVLFEESQRHRLRTEHGFLECRGLPSTNEAARIPQEAWERKVEVIVVDAVRSASAVRGVLTAAAGGALVIATLEARDTRDAIERFLEFADTASRERARERLATSVLGLLAVRPADEGSPAFEDSPDEEEAAWQIEYLPRVLELPDAVRRQDDDALATCFEDPTAIPFPEAR